MALARQKRVLVFWTAVVLCVACGPPVETPAARVDMLLNEDPTMARLNDLPGGIGRPISKKRRTRTRWLAAFD
jgi:hypothetical protein